MQGTSSMVAAALLGAVAGFGGGLASGWVGHDRAPVRVAPDDRAALAGEVRDLGEQVRALEAEVARLRQRRPGPAPAPAPEPAAAPAGSGEARPRAAAADDPAFEAAVRDVLDRIQEERVEGREERRAQGTRDWADRLAEKAQLSDAQKASVLAIAEEMAKKQREARDPDAPRTQEGRAARREELRAEGEKRLREVLSPKQMSVYQESEDLRIDAAVRGGRGRER